MGYFNILNIYVPVFVLRAGDLVFTSMMKKSLWIL